MKKIFSFGIIFLAYTGYLQAQEVQVGIMPIANVGVFQHGRSHYNHNGISSGLVPGGGAWIPVRMGFGKRTALITGFGWQRKSYKAAHSIELPGINGHVSTSRNFSCFELPLLGTYTAGDKNLRLEYQAGMVMSYNMPTSESMGFSVEGTVPGGAGVWSGAENWEKTFSPDVFVGLSLARFRDSERKWQMTLAFQYGLIATSRMNMFAEVHTADEAKYYLNFLRPALSTVSLSFTAWPTWLNLKKKETTKSALPG